MVTAEGSWSSVTAESEQLIAAVRYQCTLSEQLSATATEVSRAAHEACVRAGSLRHWHRQLSAPEPLPGGNGPERREISLGGPPRARA